ncbi:MAG: hypothetical protein RIR70_1227 [Pseudomonadota bacterium]|jgi:NADH-quinone oxidoreductase subunit N
MNFVMPNLPLAAAEIYVLSMACVVLLADLFWGKRCPRLAFGLTLITLAGAFVITFGLMSLIGGQVVPTFSNMYLRDLMGDVLKLGAYIAVFAVVVYARGFLAARGQNKGEFYLLILFGLLGMMVMITSNHFLTLYLGLELLALSVYALVALDRDSARATEAAMKYFVLGALASGLLLYGMSMIYGATGTLEISAIAKQINQGAANKQVLVFGLVFLMAGLAFKLGVAPFHMWIPDVYHGAPAPIALFIASAPKIAAFAMAMRLLVSGLFELADQWQLMLMFLAVLSLGLGNLAAIAQTNIKRMLGYSAISHMGFLALGLLSGVVEGDAHGALNAYSSAMFYALVYVVMSLAAFGMIALISKSGKEAEEITDFKGLNKRSPWLAALMGLTLFSMAGVPFFVGFWAKLSVLQATVQSGYLWLAVYAVIMSLIGAFYYLRVVKVMYFDEPAELTPVGGGLDARMLISLNGLAIVALGLFPEQLMRLCAMSMLTSF